MFSKHSFPGLSFLPQKVRRALVGCANNAVSKDTWANYNVIMKHMENCQVEFGMRFDFPMTLDMLLALVGYLRETKKLKAVTIENHLCALRYVHLSKGVFLTSLRPDMIKTLLKGMSHDDLKLKRASVDRLPVTLQVMLLLEMEIEDANNWSREYKLLVWSVATLAFFGSFRCGELLSKKANSIDPDVDLQLKDIRIVKRFVNKEKIELLEVNLKSPKEAKENVKSIKVEVFGNGTALYPLKAFKNYVTRVGVKNGNSAAFRLPVIGLAYRHQRFNNDLKSLLSKHLRYGKLSGHSFRSGLSSLLGQAGFSDSEVMAMGRWSSDSFLKYVKTGRLVRSRNSDRVINFVKSKIRSLN